MTRLREEVIINADRASIWKAMEDFGNVYQFAPGVTHSYTTNNIKSGKGAERICELAPMGKVKEKAIEWRDNEGYSIIVEPVEKMPPVKNILVSIELKQVANNKFQVLIYGSYEMKLGLIGQLLNTMVVKSNMAKGLKGTLDGLKIFVETGKQVETMKDLKNYLQAA